MKKDILKQVKDTLRGIFLRVRDILKRAFRSHPQLFISLVILVIGVLATIVLIKLRTPPKKEQPDLKYPMVRVERLGVKDIPMVVHGYGTVSPKVKIEIVPQVSGKAVNVNPKFEEGCFVKAGEQILQIDPIDYELAVRQAEAIVAEAAVGLDLEKAEAQVARQEWEKINPGQKPSSSLVFRDPQIRQAKAKLDSAKAALALAHLNLKRTSLTLPVDTLIVDEQVDVGQYIVAGQPIGVAYGVDLVEIEVPLEDNDLAWFDVPMNPASFDAEAASVKGSDVKVKAEFTGKVHTWDGYISRTTGEVDKKSRLISVIVEVKKPFESSSGKPPLMPGIFVDIFIEGHVLKNAIAVPRYAVHNRNEVWVVENNLLYIRPLDIVRADKDFVYVLSGLNDGAKVVLSSMDVDIVRDGMKVEVAGQSTDNPAVKTKDQG
ncbi:MAG: efflux RND transporter periplasmic adaptor subunit [Planctomycetota bacterium]|jgi:RND family efflux transporter MFP subunit